jgi:hypothetical protein
MDEQTYLPLRRWSRCYLRFFGEPNREISNCLGVNLRLIPFLQDSEIGSAFRPWLAARPTIAFQIVCRRSERIERTMDQITMAIAFEINCKL